LALDGTRECAGQADVEASRQNLVHGVSARLSIAASDTLLIILLYDRADPRVKRAQNIRPAAEEATASIPKITCVYRKFDSA
jgi:hypothetical protein